MRSKKKASTRECVPISPDKSVRSYDFWGAEGRRKGTSVYGTAISIDRHGRIEARSLLPPERFFSRLDRPREAERTREKDREREGGGGERGFAGFYIYIKRRGRNGISLTIYFRRTENRPRIAAAAAIVVIEYLRPSVTRPKV